MSSFHRSSPFFSFKTLLFALILSFYFIILISWVGSQKFDLSYGTDYLAFWSAGRDADLKGISHAYNVPELRDIQIDARNSLGIVTEETNYTTLPAPYLPLFILPFAILSRVNPQVSFWIWAISNLGILIGYLAFFMKKIGGKSQINLFFLFVTLLPFPVFDNFVMGQLNVLLMICMGEYFRNTIDQRPYSSGLWLGGLLLKPQLLVLLVPFLILRREWKSILGFATSSGVILLSSLLLSGVEGLVAYFRLLTGWKAGNTVTAPEAMINWRMVGVYVDHFLGSPLGLIIAAVGIAASLFMMYSLIRRKFSTGSHYWGLTMLGLVSATLAVTWHAHAHMAIVLLPFLIYAMKNQLVQERLLFFWAALTPLAWMCIGGLAMLTSGAVQARMVNSVTFAFTPTGFLANLVIQVSAIRFGKGVYEKEDKKIKELSTSG